MRSKVSVLVLIIVAMFSARLAGEEHWRSIDNGAVSFEVPEGWSSRMSSAHLPKTFEVKVKDGSVITINSRYDAYGPGLSGLENIIVIYRLSGNDRRVLNYDDVKKWYSSCQARRLKIPLSWAKMTDGGMSTKFLVKEAAVKNSQLEEWIVERSCKVKVINGEAYAVEGFFRCDADAIASKERAAIMKKVYDSLQPGKAGR